MPSDIPAPLSSIFNFEFQSAPRAVLQTFCWRTNHPHPPTTSGLTRSVEERQFIAVSLSAITDFHGAGYVNPIEYEGPYPLPEAQLESLLLKFFLYPRPRAAGSRQWRSFNARRLDQVAVAFARSDAISRSRLRCAPCTLSQRRATWWTRAAYRELRVHYGRPPRCGGAAAFASPVAIRTGFLDADYVRDIARPSCVIA